MNSKILTVLTLTMVTCLSFSSIAKAEIAPKSTVNSPASTAVVEDKSQQPAAKLPDSNAVTEDKTQQNTGTTGTDVRPETTDRNSTQTQEPVTTNEVPSSRGNGSKCGKR